MCQIKPPEGKKHYDKPIYYILLCSFLNQLTPPSPLWFVLKPYNSDGILVNVCSFKNIYIQVRKNS